MRCVHSGWPCTKKRGPPQRADRDTDRGWSLFPEPFYLADPPPITDLMQGLLDQGPEAGSQRNMTNKYWEVLKTLDN